MAIIEPVRAAKSFANSTADSRFSSVTASATSASTPLVLPLPDARVFISDILPLIISTFEFIRDFKGDVPGASAKDCGNYLDMNLPMANYLADHYLKNALYVADDKNLNYPE